MEDLALYKMHACMCLTTDPHFKTIKPLPLADVMILAKKANVGAVAFTDVLDDEINKGTFLVHV